MTIDAATKRLVILNRYYRISKFYSFLKSTSYKGGITLALFVGLILGLEFFFFDINELLNRLVTNYAPRAIFAFFLISETLLGLIPPEIFIAWAAKSINPWVFLLLLATMSYIGGIIAYFIGNRMFLIPQVKSYIEIKIEKHIINLRKWGAMFVVLGAISPIPHALVSMASGLIRYNFKHYLLWALFRYVRFILYALVIFKVL